jgi:drug/metabolite transporter (DMT)-like permease
MFPVVALVISFFFEGLEPSWNIFVGVTLVLAGNVFVLRQNRTSNADPAAGGRQAGQIGGKIGASANS